MRIRIRALECTAIVTIAFCILAALPAFLIPLGLPLEADAVDYHIPIIKWILRHGSYPNWPWSVVDDYPMLGDLLMVPFYTVRPALARIVPLCAYLGSAIFMGLFVRDWTARFRKSDESGIPAKTAMLIGVAWALGFRTLATQSNLLLVDNIATCFVLGSLYFLGMRRHLLAGVFGALAVATRYSAWPPIAAEVIAALVFFRNNKAPVKERVTFVALVCMGALPFVIRNLILNHNPVFPLLISVFGPAHTQTFIRYDVYGFGTGIISLLKFPWNLLVINEFKRHLFDYRLGALFLLQLGSFVVLSLWSLWAGRAKHLRQILPSWTVAFLALDFLFWFFSSQQLRFLLPSLLLVQGYLLAFMISQIRNRAWPGVILLALLTLGGILSSARVHKPDFDIAIGHRPTYFEPFVATASPCMSFVHNSYPVALLYRDSSLGYFDQDFVFISHHPYAVEQPGIEAYWPKTLYWSGDREVAKFLGYLPISPAPAGCPHLYVR